jgi:hypothetical protein
MSNIARERQPIFEEDTALHVLAGARATVLAAEAAVRLSGESMKDVATLVIARFAQSSAEARLAALRLALAIRARESGGGHK